MKMKVQTAVYGTLETERDKLIYFPDGIMGFPDNKQFALFPIEEGNPFCLLQSVDRRDLGFFVTDPRNFSNSRDLPKRMTLSGDSQVYITVCQMDGGFVGNLAGPLVVDPKTRRGRQEVLSGYQRVIPLGNQLKADRYRLNGIGRIPELN